jgi:hypothetical protein
MLKLTKNFILLIAIAFAVISCNNNTENKNSFENNADIAKLSDGSKKAIDEATKVGCKCLKEHGSELKSVLDELKPVLAEAEKSENPMEVMGKVMGSMMKMQNFGQCMKDADPGEFEGANALSEDMKKILGDNPEPNATQKKQMELFAAYFNKNCPNDAKIFDDFIKFGEAMQALSSKR